MAIVAIYLQIRLVAELVGEVKVLDPRLIPELWYNAHPTDVVPYGSDFCR